MSDLTTSLPPFLPTAAESRRLSLPAKPLKIALAVAAALIGGYGVLSDREYIATSDAVVSTYVLDVRTPIEGMLVDVPSTAGDTVRAGALLGRVGNALTDRQHLDNLRMTEEAARSTAASLAKEQKALEAMRRVLLSRAAVHTQAMSQRMAEQAEEARLTLAAKQAALEEADVEVTRGQKLVGWGVIARAAYDKLTSAQQVLANQVRAQRAVYASLQTEVEAGHHGVLAEPGANNDVAYSTQRADEVSIRLAENARELDAAMAQAREAHSAAEAEGERTSLLGSSEVRAPSAGMIWKLNAINGEHVKADAPVLSLVDCNRQFVLAEVPQDRVSAIMLKSKVEIKLTGESIQRTGTVMSVSGDAQRELDAKLAAAPVRRSTEDLATIVIRLDPLSGAETSDVPCLIGRTARVRIPTQPTNLLTLWLSQRL